MATKLKNISRKRLTKAIVLFISLFWVWSLVTVTGTFFFEHKHNSVSFMAETLFAQNYFETSEAQRKIRNGILNVLSLLEAEDVNGLSKYTASLDYIVVDKSNNLKLTVVGGKEIEQNI